MTSILIAGPAKSGTSALYSSAKDNLPECIPIFEPCRDYQFEFIRRKITEGEQLVSKIIYTNVELEKNNFSYFDKLLVIARDPRDMLVSWLLYVSFLNERYKNDEYRKKFIALLKKKEADPSSVSLVEIAHLMNSHGFELKSDEDFTLDLIGAKHFLEKYPDCFLIKYEDFLAGDVSELNHYSGLTLGTDTEVSHYVKYNSRSRSAGNWRHWFTAEDIEHYRPLMLEYMTYFGYEDDWSLSENPVIEAKVSSKYVKRYFKRLKKLPNRFGLLRTEAEYTPKFITHLKSAAANGAEGAMIELALAALYGYQEQEVENTYEYWINRAIKYGSPSALVHLGVAIESGIITDNRNPAKLYSRAGELLGNAATKRMMQEVRRMYHMNDPVRFASILDVTVNSLNSAHIEINRHVAIKTDLENRIQSYVAESEKQGQKLKEIKDSYSKIEHEFKQVKQAAADKLSKSQREASLVKEQSLKKQAEDAQLIKQLDQELSETSNNLEQVIAEKNRLEMNDQQNSIKLKSLTTELSSVQKKVSTSQAKEAEMREQLRVSDLKYTELSHDLELKLKQEALRRKSISYQFILHTRKAFSSFSGFVRYPLALARLAKRWILRRKKVGQQQFKPVIELQPEDNSSHTLINDKKNSDEKAVADIKNEEASSLETRVNEFLDEFDARDDIKNLIYADISLEVIDGSSIWLTSMTNILALHNKTVILLKSNPAHDHLTKNLAKNNLTILTPEDFGEEILNVAESVNIIRQLDNRMPRLNCIVIRGLDAACEVHASRQFKKRSALYLTDFYSYGESGRGSTQEQMNKVISIRDHAGVYLVQTQEIKSALELLAGSQLKTHLLPPPLPVLPEQVANKQLSNPGIKFVYAGKITPEWGVVEMLDCIEMLKSNGIEVSADIISNKITAKEHARYFRGSITKRIKDLKLNLINGLSRQEVFEYIQAADFVWCWRPASLELSTIELSTKLIEAVALGKPAITYPSKTNKECLGSDYPYYLSDPSNISSLVTSELDFDLQILSSKLQKRHGFNEISQNFESVVPTAKIQAPKLLFAGHDWKFIDAYISKLKTDGHYVERDEWEWGEAKDLSRSESLYQASDIIFCEWGLANAVWYAERNLEKKPLYIRLHAQEVRQKARKFGSKIKIENVTKAIFVSETVRQSALKLWDWPIEKTMVIPNFVMDDEYQITSNEKRVNASKQKIVLGILGIVPSLKRFDRAISLVEQLTTQGYEVELRVKGHRPETLDYMHAPGRKDELEYYYEQYNRIESDPLIKERVRFDPFGHDVAQWYQGIDCILSCSDSESFHYALADGVLSGCLPIVWPWEGSEKIYPAEWLVSDYDDAIEKIVDIKNQSTRELNQVLRINREYIVKHYGQDAVFDAVSAELFRNNTSVKHLNVVRQTA